MDFSQPFRALTPTLDGPVLRVLARTTQPLTRQQVADLVGEASEAGVRKVLRRLAEQGVVIEQRIGTYYTYVGNREHILWPAVEVFVSAAARLDASIREHVEAWEIPALSVELFGSVAAGTSTADSDVDLMIYRRLLTDDQWALWDSQVAELRMAVQRWTGNACEILEIDSPTLVEMVAEDEPVLRAPRIPIIGNIDAAVPPREIAKTLQGALSSNDISQVIGIQRVAQKLVGQSPEFRHTIDELLKVMSTPALKSIQTQQAQLVKMLGTNRLSASKEAAELAKLANSPVAGALRKQRH